MNSNPPAEVWAFIAAYLGFILGIVCFIALIQAVVCWFLGTCIQKIPAEHRQLTPGAPWLFLIGFVPCLGGIFVAIYNFMFWPKLSQSFKSYFDSVGRPDVGDCGQQLGMMYCIGAAIVHVLAIIGYIPYLGLISLINCLLGPAVFVLWIILLVKAGQYKGMIPDQVDSTPEFPISNTQG